MDRAIELARQAAGRGEVPVGAVICDHNGNLVAEAANQTRAPAGATGHAEMRAIQAACARLARERLDGCDLYVTLEPCAMCAGAIAHARLRRLYFAAEDPKGGAVLHGPRLFYQPTIHHRPEIYHGMGEESARDLLVGFFRDRRQPLQSDSGCPI